MGILKNRKKVNVSDRLKQGMYDTGVGVAFAVVEDAIGIPTDVEKAKSQEDLMSIGALAVGIGLPILMPGTDKFANPIAAIGAYKVGKSMKVAEKLGLTDEAATTTGLGDRSALGNTSRMFDTKRRAENRSNSGGSNTVPNPLG